MTGFHVANSEDFMILDYTILIGWQGATERQMYASPIAKNGISVACGYVVK